MDQLPLDHNPVPGTGPRNLTAQLAIWLRKMGFLVLEQGGLVPNALEGTWRAPDNMLYQVSYAYSNAGGIFQLLVYTGRGISAADYRGLVHKAEINRLRDARFLLLSNVFYAEARKAALAAGTLQPAHLTTT